MYDFDLELSKDHKIVCGVDEVGRGPLAGPVYSCALIFSYVEIEGINDSKKLSEKKREYLFDKINKNNISYKIGISSVEEIEEMNILNASLLSMKRAVENLEITPDLILVDGNIAPKFAFDVNVKTIVKGDSTSYSISCASIVAKVMRDRFMKNMHLEFPVYRFDKNKGYGTKDHIDAIKKYGPCKIHRMSFLKNII